MVVKSFHNHLFYIVEHSSLELVYNVRLLRYARFETGRFGELNASH